MSAQAGPAPPSPRGPPASRAEDHPRAATAPPTSHREHNSPPAVWGHLCNGRLDSTIDAHFVQRPVVCFGFRLCYSTVVTGSFRAEIRCFRLWSGRCLIRIWSDCVQIQFGRIKFVRSWFWHFVDVSREFRFELRSLRAWYKSLVSDHWLCRIEFI